MNKLTIEVKKLYVSPAEVNCNTLHSNSLLLFPYSSQHKFYVQFYLFHASLLTAFLSVRFIPGVSFYYLLTPWYRVLLEKLTGLQLVRNFPAFHGTRMFVTALTSVRHLPLSWASPIKSIYPHLTSWRSILILSTHLCLGLPLVSFPPVSPTRSYTHPPFFNHTRHMPSPSHSPRFYHPHNIG